MPWKAFPPSFALKIKQVPNMKWESGRNVFLCLPVSRKCRPRQSDFGLCPAWSWGHRESQGTVLWLFSSLSPTTLPGIQSYHSFGLDVLSFWRWNLEGGNTGFAWATGVLNICVELEETKPCGMGCGCLRLVPAQQTMRARGNQRSGPHLAN